MTTFVHALEFDTARCDGRLACIRVCPTDAMRVRNGKVRVSSSLCIDCGNCLTVCPSGTIKPRTDSWEQVEKFPFKVAVVSPTLFAQFPPAITPADIVDGLHAIGFDAVHDVSIESELYHLATQDYLDDYDGPLPVISALCPVVVRLIQVSYPDMVDQIMPIEPPREIAGLEVKRIYSEREGIPPEDIGAIYISPCPAKIVSIKQPAEGGPSNLDIAIAINELYNPLLAAITRKEKDLKAGRTKSGEFRLRSDLFLNLAVTGGQSRALRQSRPMSVAHLPNIIRIFEDIEKGKLRTIEFLECYSCIGGCIGGAFTVDNRFVARAKIFRMLEGIDRTDDIKAEAEKRYIKGEHLIQQPINPRPIKSRDVSFKEKIRRVKVQERYSDLLPGVDCGLCGAPTCEVFAADVANGYAKPEECVFLDRERLEKLKEVYGIVKKALNIDFEE